MKAITVARAAVAVTFLSVFATGCAVDSSNEDPASTDGAIEEEQGVDVASSEAAYSSSGCRVSVPRPVTATARTRVCGDVHTSFSASCSRVQRLRTQICLQEYVGHGTYRTHECDAVRTTVDDGASDYFNSWGNENGLYRTRVNVNGSYYYSTSASLRFPNGC